MKFFKIVLFLILWFNASAQIELFQLQWATDSSYVIGALPSGEPVWVHKDSLGFGRIYDYNQTSVYYSDIPNPQKDDIYVDDQYDSSGKNRYYDGSTWQIFDYDGYVGNEGRLYVLDGSSYNTARIRSYHGDYTDAVLKGDSLVKVNSVFDSNILDITIDTVNLLDLTTQYLNPYVVTGDTVGFYLTVAVDTVLFENTIDTAAYCCPPSLSGDTLYIDDNYVVLPVANIVGGWGIDATESPANTWNLIADSSQVATQYDLTLIGGSQTLSIDSTNRVFEISISGGNSVKFKDTGGIDSTTVVNSYGTTITESPANQWNIKVDSSKFATAYDLTQISGGLPEYGLLDHGSSSGATQTLTGSTWNTITFTGAQESDSGVINADASTEEIDFVVAGTYRIEYYATWISIVSSYVLAGVYSDNGAAQLTKSQVQVRSQTGNLSTTVHKVFYHTATAGETIKLQINPDATHTGVGIYSYFIATKVN